MPDDLIWLPDERFEEPRAKSQFYTTDHATTFAPSPVTRLQSENPVGFDQGRQFVGARGFQPKIKSSTADTPSPNKRIIVLSCKTDYARCSNFWRWLSNIY